MTSLWGGSNLSQEFYFFIPAIRTCFVTREHFFFPHPKYTESRVLRVLRGKTEVSVKSHSATAQQHQRCLPVCPRQSYRMAHVSHQPWGAVNTKTRDTLKGQLTAPRGMCWYHKARTQGLTWTAVASDQLMASLINRAATFNLSPFGIIYLPCECDAQHPKQKSMSAVVTCLTTSSFSSSFSGIPHMTSGK